MKSKDFIGSILQYPYHSRAEMPSTYILVSEESNRYYVGYCGDLSKRLSQHNKGLVRSTKPYTPWKLIYQETFDTLNGARKREAQLKSWKKRKALERLFNK